MNTKVLLSFRAKKTTDFNYSKLVRDNLKFLKISMIAVGIEKLHNKHFKNILTEAFIMDHYLN